MSTRSKLKKLVQNFFTHKVVKNFSYLTVSSVLSQVISLLTVLKITSILVPADYGLYTFLMVQGTLLLTIGDLGTGNIIVRSIARNRERTNDLALNAGILRIGALIILSLLYVIYNSFLGSLTGTEVMLVFVFSFINGLFKLFENIYLGNQKMLTPSLIGLVYSILWLATVYVIPKEFMDVSTLFYAFLLLNGLKVAVIYFVMRSQKLFIGEINQFRSSSIKLLKESWPYFMMVLIMVPFNHLSNNYLDINSTPEEVGYYNLALRLIGPMSLVIGFALLAIFPNLSALWVDNKEQYRKYVSVGFKYFMIIALTACFLFTLFVADIVVLLFPESYLPAVKVCQLHVWYVFLTSIDSLIGTILGSINKEKLILRFGVIYLIVCTPALYYGSTFGAYGLSVAYVFSFGICQFYVWHVFTKSTNLKIGHSVIIWTFAAILFVISNTIPFEGTFLFRILISLVGYWPWPGAISIE